jgi:uncharacterized repeat protein (TIGR01451 family)
MDDRLFTTKPDWPWPKVAVWPLFKVAFLALSLISIALAPPAFAANPPLVQTYYVPLPEQQVRGSLEAINTTGDTGTEIDSVVSIVSSDADTLVYYDHWEDGYEPDITDPVQDTTEIWGDGDTGNGDVSTHCATCTGDTLDAGDVVALRNLVDVPRDTEIILFDGRDKIDTTKTVAVTRAEYATDPGTVLAGAVEVYSTDKYGLAFEIPIGDNLSSNEMFQYASLFVMASTNGTVCTYAGGSAFTLNQGENHHENGGVDAGEVLSCSKAVQAHLITGDIGSRYESRWFTLFPTDQWSNSYYAPVGTTSSDDPADVWVYNPVSNGGPLSVQVATLSGSATISNIATGSAMRYEMPSNSAAHLSTAGGEPFFAIGTVDSDQAGSDNETHDWGYSLVPERNLTPVAVVGWGPGTANLSHNGNPVWVTVQAPTRVYVDYDGDPTTGSLTDSNLDKYDVHYDLSTLQSQTIYDDNDNDQTGMRLYTLDGVLLTAAWGQDASTAGPSNPYLDMGTTVLPLPSFTAIKRPSLYDDDNADGLYGPRDTIEYTVYVTNTGAVPLTNVVISEIVPADTTYDPGSTAVDGIPVPDDSAPSTPFPLDEGGLYIGDLPIGDAVAVSYRMVIVTRPVGTEIINQAVIRTDQGALEVSVTIPIEPMPEVSPAIDIEKAVWPSTIRPGELVTYSYSVTNPGDAHLCDVDPISDDKCALITGPAGDDGDGLLAPDSTETWVYSCTTTLDEDTTNTATATGQACDASGTPYPDVLPVSDQDTADVDVIHPKLDMEKSAEPELIDPGDLVIYTYEVTNPGDDPLDEVSVTDSHCSPVTGPAAGGDGDGDAKLDPGETWVYSCTQAVLADTVNVALATFADSLGGEQTAEDDAFVDVIIAGIQLEKGASASVVYPGANVTYAYTVTNTGADPLSDIQVVDNFCDSPTYQNGDENSDELLDVGEEWLYSCSAVVHEDTINTALATGLDPLGRPRNDLAAAQVDVINPAVRVEKSVDKAVVLSGTDVEYTYEVTNPGDDPLASVTVTDTHCDLLSGPEAGDDVNGNGKLDPGEKWVYSCTATITEDTVNTAHASGEDSLGNHVGPATDTAEVDVIHPEVDVQKTVDKSVVLTGETVHYTFLVSNTGDLPLSLVLVEDDRCAPLGYESGDDGDFVLTPGGTETWQYGCTTIIFTDTLNTVTASGQPSDDHGAPLPGIPRVHDQDTETVVVRPRGPTVEIDKRLVSVDLDEHYPNYANFEIIITNVGPTVLDTVPLFDEYDPYYLGLVGASPVQTVPLNPEDSDGAVTWHDLTLAAPHGFGENLAPGESFKVTIVFVIEHDITTYTTNLARVENATDVRGVVAPPVEDEEMLIGVPTAVDLLYFWAHAEDAFITVEWETAMEEDVWGFELYRGTTSNLADAEWIHSELSQGGRFAGHYYRYDDADIVSGQTYYYWLATVDSGPSETTRVIAGPAVSAHFGHRVYMPAIIRR